MERVQFALQKQLKGAYDIAVLKLSEQSEELARQLIERRRARREQAAAGAAS